MPTATCDEWKKASKGTTFADWKEWPAHNEIERENKARDAAWSQSCVVSIKSDKKYALRWAACVRAQYGPAKRALRVLRWHSKPRHESAAARLFHKEAMKWKDDTMHWSSAARIISHPSYLRIIGLGRKFKEGEIERLILQELEYEPYHWFDALAAITGENPVGPNDDFDTAVNAWLEWGRQEGIIANDNPARTQR